MKYRPEIDGLRAVAVLPVIFFHAGFGLFDGGFVGVDVFFVISGYLISTIIINELEEGRFSIADFYERRARRILPALFVVVGCSTIMAWMFLLKHDFYDYFKSVVAVATFSSNIYFWLESDYFDTAAELKPLLHTWSLAVEEQFYILFPLIMMVMWRFGKLVISACLVGIFFASLGYAQWIVYDQPMTAFFLLPTRAWEIMIGAFCAFYLHKINATFRNQTVVQALSLTGLLLIAGSIFGYDETTPTPGLYMLMPTVGAALVILFSNDGTIANRILSQRLAVGIGLISYSAYLWHQPIFSFTRHNALDEPEWFVMLALSVLTLALAWMSWRFVERPFRHASVARNTVFSASALSICVLLALGLFVHLNSSLAYGNGKFNRVDKDIAILKYSDDNTHLQKQSWTILRQYADKLTYLNGAGSSNNDRKWFNSPNRKLRLLLVGDSHSKDMFNILFMSEVASNHIQLGRFNAEIRDLRDDHIFFKNQNYLEADAIMISARYDERRGDVANLEKVVNHVLKDGKIVVLVENIFEFPTYLGGKWTVFDKVVRESISRGIRDGKAISEESDHLYYSIYSAGATKDHVIAANAEINRLKELHPEIIVLDRMDYICSDETRSCYSGNAVLEKYFPDYGHHTLAGAAFFSAHVDAIDWLRPIINASKDKYGWASVAGDP